MDPFGTTFSNELPCIPDDFVVPSMKWSQKLRTQFVIGTSGIGYLVASPLCFGSDLGLYARTEAGFDGTTISSTEVADKVSVFLNHKFPWTYDNVPLVRMVAFGLRARYIGTELNRGGRLMTTATTNINDTLSGDSLNDLLSRPETESYSCDRAWKSVGYRPTDIGSSQYSRVSQPVTTAANCNVVILATGTAGNTYEAEIIIYYEMTSFGDNVISNSTQSHADPIGYSWIRDYLASVAASEIGTKVLTGFQRYVSTKAMQSISGYMNGQRRLQWDL